MDCIFIEIIETGERRKLDRPIFLTVNRNDPLTTECLTSFYEEATRNK